MPELTGYKQITLKELIAAEGVGEEGAKRILSGYSCPLNKDVEDFLRNKAIEFTKQSLAATHLVFTSYKGEIVLVGYYALSSKPVSIRPSDLSSALRQRLRRFAKYEPLLKRYCFALPLIGQLGKNYSNGYNTLITGDELLKMACDAIQETQRVLSGKMAYLECDDVPELIAFYTSNGFRVFAHRNREHDEHDGGITPYLVQMLRYFDD
jgi:hypothetical protein